MRILEMARSVSLLFSDDDHGDDLYAAIGRPVSRAGSAATNSYASWRQDRLAAFKTGGR